MDEQFNELLNQFKEKSESDGIEGKIYQEAVSSLEENGRPLIARINEYASDLNNNLIKLSLYGCKNCYAVNLIKETYQEIFKSLDEFLIENLEDNDPILPFISLNEVPKKVTRIPFCDYQEIPNNKTHKIIDKYCA